MKISIAVILTLQSTAGRRTQLMHTGRGCRDKCAATHAGYVQFVFHAQHILHYTNYDLKLQCYYPFDEQALASARTHAPTMEALISD